MAGFKSVGAVGKSIEALFNDAFVDAPPVDGYTTSALLVRSDDLERGAHPARCSRRLSILLYRVDFNKTMRASWSSLGSVDGFSHLPLDLHFLLTAWADNAEHEHQIIGRALQAIETVGALSGPLLYPSGDWDVGEAVQLYLEDMATDDLMRTFDALRCDFRLSVPYIARVVVVSGLDADPPVDVTTVVSGMAP